MDGIMMAFGYLNDQNERIFDRYLNVRSHAKKFSFGDMEYSPHVVPKPKQNQQTKKLTTSPQSIIL